MTVVLTFSTVPFDLLSGVRPGTTRRLATKIDELIQFANSFFLGSKSVT
jgi:hypothetical protein